MELNQIIRNTCAQSLTPPRNQFQKVAYRNRHMVHVGYKCAPDARNS